MAKKNSSERYNNADSWREIARYLGQAIHVARVRRRITQEQLALELGRLLRLEIRQSYISKIEKGHSHPSLERLGVICIAIGCPPDRLMAIARYLAENDGRTVDALLKEILPDGAPGRATVDSI